MYNMTIESIDHGNDDYDQGEEEEKDDDDDIERQKFTEAEV